jgi:hypothetical protein
VTWRTIGCERSGHVRTPDNTGATNGKTSDRKHPARRLDLTKVYGIPRSIPMGDRPEYFTRLAAAIFLTRGPVLKDAEHD